MLIEETKLRHWIDNFYGYGSWKARTWFIGYEESGGDAPEDVAERINYFYEADPANNEGDLCDIRELYKNVSLRSERSDSRSFSSLYEYRFGVHAIQNSLWKNLIAFGQGIRNEIIPDTLEYQKYVFASTKSLNESWILLFPLPSPHNHAWYYSWLDIPQLSFLKSRMAYQEHAYQHRMDRILSNIFTYKPEVVLMYAMNNINTIKKSVQEYFQNTEFKSVNSIKQQIPPHHYADLNGTNLLITTQVPTLKHKRIGTGFDWEELGRRLKKKN